MRPVWIKPHTEKERAFIYTLEKCGVTDKEASLALTTAFKSFKLALGKHSLPDEIDVGLFKFRLSKFKLFLRMLKYGIWLRNNIINKFYYIYLMLPVRIRYEKLFWRRKLSLVQRKDDYLFMKNEYDNIMEQWLKDIKQYVENNNMMMYMSSSDISASMAFEELQKYKMLMTTRNKRIRQDKQKENG